MTHVETIAIRLVVADDHPVVLHGLVSALNRDRHLRVVGTASNGAEAVARYRELRPDVIVLDLRMPQMDGLKATRHIRKIDPNARILILTTFDADDEIYAAFQNGARGYVLKESSAESIIDAVLTIHSGRLYIPESISRQLADRVDPSSLAPREAEVLRLAASGCKNKEIATILGISPGTVKGHVNSILVKLNASNRTDAVVIALRRGLISAELGKTVTPRSR